MKQTASRNIMSAFTYALQKINRSGTERRGTTRNRTIRNQDRVCFIFLAQASDRVSAKRQQELDEIDKMTEMTNQKVNFVLPV
jgi:hypothetical protein